MGYLVLQGGGEFRGWMRRSDQRALELAGGPEAVVYIIPAAAAPDHNHDCAGQNGQQWFRAIGANNVTVVDLIDRRSAEDLRIASKLSRGDLIYLLGGFAGYLAGTLMDTIGWRAMGDAFRRGGVIAGSSAGAMVLGQYLYDPERGQVVDGLGLLPGVCVMPHYDEFGWQWAPRLQKQLPKTILLGIDEETGVINDAGPYGWTVYGRGAVTLYSQDGICSYADGMQFTLPVPQRPE